jgi:hypothetical protein
MNRARIRPVLKLRPEKSQEKKSGKKLREKTSGKTAWD